MKDIKKRDFDKKPESTKSEHPDHLMKRLLDKMASIETKDFLTKAGLNQERELFIAVLFAYAIRKWSNREWFIQKGEDPPDFYVVSPTERKIKERPMDKIAVELVEMRTGILEDAISCLERTKLTNYCLESGTILLIFINATTSISTIEQLTIWIVRNREKFSVFSEIYILYIVSFSKEFAIVYNLVNILKVWHQDCNLSEEFNRGIRFNHKLIEDYLVNIVE